MTKKGTHISFEHDNCLLIYHNGAVFNITQTGCLYYLKDIVSARKATYKLHTWHKILGHCNESDIKKLPNLVKRMKIKLTPNYALNCDICIQGKMSNDRNKTLDCKATKILALVHSDLAGPIQPLAKDRYRYILNFIDDYSGLTMLYFSKQKSDTLLTTMKYLTDIAPYGHKKCLWTDNRMEFTSEPFQRLLVLNRIKHEQSAPYSPHQNGTAERSWWTLFSNARCLLIESKLPQNLWVYALIVSMYIRNHCYNKNTRKTPYESFTGSKQNLNKMHIFGTTYFCYLQNKMKLDPHCEKGIFVGYNKQSPAYLIYFPETIAIKRVRCVKFTDSYDNSSLSKPNKNTEFPEYLIT